jgi:peptidoglycan/LPS O-acetylase OafA/YrhL
MPSFSVSGSPIEEGGVRSRLPYLPGIDGLRAIAVLAVVLYHASPGLVPGGFFGVDVFFVISGYLITSFLWADWKRNRDVGASGFWFRRARRLLPAVAALIFGLSSFAILFLPDEVAALRQDALAAAAYVTNWYLIVDQQSYFESFARPSLLRHLWSLAIEEQFYILWPLVLMVVLPRISPKAVVPVILAVAAGSWVLMALLYEPGADPSRVYYGTDTRIGGLLIGAAMAFVWDPWKTARPKQPTTSLALNIAGFCALAGIAISFLWFEDSDTLVYRGGFALVTLLSAIAVAAAARPWTIPGRIIGTAPFVWVGVRSYSIYLWHWPVLMLTRPGIDVSMDGLELWAFRAVLVLGLAELSFRFVETPIRNGALGRWWRAVRTPHTVSIASRFRPLAAALLAFALLIGVAFRVSQAERPEEPDYFKLGSVSTVSWSTDLHGDREHPERVLSISTATPTPAPPPRPTITPGRTVAPTAPPTAAPTPVPTPIPTPPPPPQITPIGGRVLAVGDSVMMGAVSQLQAQGNVEVDAAISRQFKAGVEVLEARRAAGTLGDVVVIQLGGNGYIQNDEFNRMMAALEGVPRVVLVTIHMDREWQDANNGLLTDRADDYPNTVLADWHALASSHPEWFLSDGIHLTGPGPRAYAEFIAQYF